MRHTELRTTPREHDVKVRTHHGRKHDKHEVVRRETGGELERREPRRIHDLFENMERLMEEAWNRPIFGFGLPMMRTLLPDWGRFETRIPVTDMYEAEGAIVVRAEVPGVAKEDVTVTVEGNRLMISGTTDREEKREEKEYIRVERSHGTFERVITLPDGIDLDNVTATLKDGILEIRLPRTAESTPRTITVA